MHDPYTQVLEWPRYGGFLHRALHIDGALFTIWHRDRGGADGACGWSYPHLTDDERLRIRDFAWWEERDPYFLRCPAKSFHGSRSEAETLYRQLVLLTARALRLHVSIEEATSVAVERTSNGGFEDGARAFCYVPGYHTNFAEDRPGDRQDHFASVMYGVARYLKARHRQAWRHPRWHVHHWRVTVHPIARGWSWLRAWRHRRRHTQQPQYTFGEGTMYVNGVEAGKIESCTVTKVNDTNANRNQG